MSFMDELRKLTQPYEDEDDFYEGADPSAQPPAPTEAQLELRKRAKTPLRQRRKAEEREFSPAWEEKRFRGRGSPLGNGRWSSAERNSRSSSSIPRALMKPVTWCSI